MYRPGHMLGTFLLGFLAVAKAAAETETFSYPIRYSWDFETVDDDGKDVFAADIVPIFLDERPTQPFWVQRFGSAASPVAPDRFPRSTVARFVHGSQVNGRRSLHLLSRGDNLLVALDQGQKKRIFGEAEITFRGWVRTSGLEHGALRVALRFYESGFEIPGTRLVSAPLRGDRREWSRDLSIRGRAPVNAEEFDIEIRLAGSHRDPLASVWLDAFEAEIMPGCRLSWPERTNLLIQPNEPVQLKVECFGLPRGNYRVQIQMERNWPEGDSSSLGFDRARYVPSTRQPLRLLEDLRSHFFLANENLGAGLYSVQVSILEDSELISSARNQFVWIPNLEESTPTPTVRFGWVLPFEKLLSEDSVQNYQYGKTGFPLHQTLIDLESWAPEDTKARRQLPSEDDVLARLRAIVAANASAEMSIDWNVRITWGRIEADRWADFFVKNLPGLRVWAIRTEKPLTDEDAQVLIDLKRESPILEFGAAPDADGRIPGWAQFRVLEGDPDTLGKVTYRPTPKDWVIVALPTDLSVSERISYFGRMALDLTRLGFRRILVNKISDFFLLPIDLHRELSPPDPYMLGWIGVGRFLAKSSFIKEYPWDSRGTFLLFNDYVDQDTLVFYSKTAESFTLGTGGDSPLRDSFRDGLWTGEPLEGRDLLGTALEVPFDSKRGSSKLDVGPVPIFVAPMPTGRLETGLSLRRVTTRLKPWPRTQHLYYDVKNSTDHDVEMELDLEVPTGWKSRPQTGLANLKPGQDARWHFQVDLPQPPPLLRSFLFRVVMKINDRGTEYTRFHEEWIPVGSDVVELKIDPRPLGARTVPFRLRNLFSEALRLRLFAKVIEGDLAGFARTWTVVLAPKQETELTFKLPTPLRALVGQEIWIGFQVGGRGDFNTFAFEVKEDAGVIVLQ